jgi:hypothetical protein
MDEFKRFFIAYRLIEVNLLLVKDFYSRHMARIMIILATKRKHRARSMNHAISRESLQNRVILRSIAVMKAYLASLNVRAIRLIRGLPRKMNVVIAVWLALVSLMVTAKVAFSPSPIFSAGDLFNTAMPYLLIALAPIAGYRIALSAFGTRILPAQPAFRLALYGQWQNLDPLRARSHPAFGPDAFMVSLMIGMLLNIPVRTLEFLAAVPAMNANAPAWGTTLFHVMAFDVIAMNFIYAVCFVMALRSIPLFPRMLGFAWAIDIAMQFAIAHRVGLEGDLPPVVGSALQDLLNGNITKVLISVTIWLPYLLLSERVNVTFRARASAS